MDKYQVPIDMLQDMCVEKGLKTAGDRDALIDRLEKVDKPKARGKLEPETEPEPEPEPETPPASEEEGKPAGG